MILYEYDYTGSLSYYQYPLFISHKDYFNLILKFSGCLRLGLPVLLFIVPLYYMAIQYVIRDKESSSLLIESFNRISNC